MGPSPLRASRLRLTTVSRASLDDHPREERGGRWDRSGAGDGTAPGACGAEGLPADSTTEGPEKGDQRPSAVNDGPPGAPNFWNPSAWRDRASAQLARTPGAASRRRVACAAV